MPDALERLKILLSSSTPIVVMETVEEMRAVRLVRAACSSLNLATFEWSIASGLVRCGSEVGELVPDTGFSATGPGHDQSGAQALYNSKEPAQALSNLEAMSLEAAFVLKDFHRHMDDPVVVRRLRDVGQKFSTNRRTIIITAPSVTIPAELASLVEVLGPPGHRGRCCPRLRSGTAARGDHSWSARLRQEYVRPSHRRRMEAAAGEVRYRCHLRQVHRRNRKADPEGVSRCRRTRALRVLDRRAGKGFRRKRGGFGVSRCRSFFAHPRSFPFLH